jgi:hypothetical protein
MIEGQQMAQLMIWVGRLAGFLGVIACAVALAARLAGSWAIGGIQIGTLLQLGMAAMILACLAYCAVLVERPRR